MRMRHKKHGAERIAACADLLITPPDQDLVDPDSVFPSAKPISLEIGCGKGDFAIGMAKKNPEENWIAMERVPDVACIALEKAMATGDERADNLRFLISNARNLQFIFPKSSISAIYLNFSDPWPKSGYAKRRLTHMNFLKIYQDILKPNGILKLKTDNQGLFDFSLEQFRLFGLKMIRETRDLHQEEWAKENIMTEYERNFSSRGTPICSAWVQFPQEKADD